ncbi:MAG: hypothetical protein M0R80_11115 [Proteobacteria bacterium]|jgi:hypothetical protein|nr:hypothetical protein [Pseudomonadota bacterium]
MTRSLCIVALLCAACAPGAAGDPQIAPAAAAATPGAASADAQADGSTRLTIRLAPGGPEVLSRADSDESVQRRDPYRNEPTFFRVVDGAGRVLAERGFRLEDELRSEAPAADGTLSGEHVPLEAPIVSLQIPRFAGAAAVRLYRRGANGPELLAEVTP